MCGCGKSMGVTSTSSTTMNANIRVIPPVEDCEYTIEQLKTWLKSLVCVKDKGIYTQFGINGQTMNKYLGIVMSAINYPSNPCYFQNDLEAIGNFIIIIINSGQCQDSIQ